VNFQESYRDTVTSIDQPALFAAYSAKNDQPLLNSVAAERGR